MRQSHTRRALPPLILSGAPRTRGGVEGGFTLIEVLVALFIVATALAALQLVTTGTMGAAVDANRLRVAKMLLRQKAEEVALRVEAGTAGSFDGYPGYRWEVSEVEHSVSDDPPAAVRSVTVAVYLDSPSGQTMDAPPDEGQDGPNVVRVFTLLDPPDAELKPPSAGQPQAGGQPPAGGGGR